MSYCSGHCSGCNDDYCPGNESYDALWNTVNDFVKSVERNEISTPIETDITFREMKKALENS